jgi:hypothetical protein
MISDICSKWDSLSKNQKIYLTKLRKQVEQNIAIKVESLNKESVPNSLSVPSRVDHESERIKLKTELENIEKHVIEIESMIKRLNSIIDKQTSNQISNIKVIDVMPKPSVPQPVYEEPKIQPVFRPYLLGLKAKTSEVAIVPIKDTPDTEIKLIKITPDSFTDNYGFSIFPLDHSRYVNLHDSILVTGGMERGFSYENCYLVTINNIENRYTIIISNYVPMQEKRERHNIIYLEHLKSVLVCSGFYTKSCEINNLNFNTSTSWSYVPEMKEYRANATMFCVNNRYVYCVGGFQVIDRERATGGVYLNSLEYADSLDFNKGWTNVELSSLNISLKLCAMGIMTCSANKILIVGGYDGNKYLAEVSEMSFDQDGIISRINMNGKVSELGKGIIFTSNQIFLNTPFNKMINFDSNCRLVTYDLSSGEFSVKA